MLSVVMNLQSRKVNFNKTRRRLTAKCRREDFVVCKNTACTSVRRSMLLCERHKNYYMVYSQIQSIEVNVT